MYTRILAALLISTLTACGGGGGSSSAAPTPEASSPTTNTPPPEPTPVPEVEVDKEVRSTADLETSADFALGSNRTVTIDVDITGLGNNSGYLSICSLQDNSEPNYKNCMVRVAINQNRYQGSVMLSTAVDRVVSAIWFLDLSLDPLIQVHEVGSGRLEVSH